MNIMKVLTVIVVYMVVSLPGVYAQNVNIAFGSTTDSVVLTEQVVRTVWVSGSAQLNIKVAKKTNTVDTVYLYKCKNKTPSSCVSTETPELFSDFGGEELTITDSWITFADQTQSYPQTGTFLLLVKTLSVSGETWHSYWHTVSRTNENFQPLIHQSEDITSITVNAKTIDIIPVIKNFIQSTNMIPVNTNWVTSVDFTGANTLHMLKTNAPASFQTEALSSSLVTSFSHDFLFGHSDDGIVKNGITLNRNPSFTPGDGQCEVTKGESSANSCADCDCSSGLYCDISNDCKPLSGISASLVPPTTTSIQSCNKANSFDVNVQINNMPTDAQVTASTYTLGDKGTFGTACTKTGNQLKCTITVPADPKCNEGTFNIGPNKLDLSLGFTDGHSTSTKELSLSFPNINIGSWTCGNDICEDGLGEQGNCCHDCGCGTGLFCDIEPGKELSSGECKQSPSSSSINILNLAHTTPATTATFSAQISNPPKSLQVGQATCSATCIKGNTKEDCSASCSTTCTKKGLTHEYDCSLSFSITNYDQLVGYSVTPTLGFPVSYINGPSAIQTTISKQVGVLGLGPTFCGDGKCDPARESSTTCCYDCGCSNQLFCNTVDITQPSPGDFCGPENIELVIDKVTPTQLKDHSLQHKVNITAHVTNKPQGFNVLSTSCRFGDTTDCTVQCKTDTSPVGRANLECSILIPVRPYYTSPFWNEQTQQVEIGPNTFSAVISYNNGSVKQTKQFSVPFSDITITPVAHCGADLCESGLGENAANCCIDCPCALDPQYGPGHVCIPGGREKQSACVQKSSISLLFNKSLPKLYDCSIQAPHLGNQCAFAGAVNFITSIPNKPQDLRVQKAFIKHGDTLEQITCADKGNNSFSCPLRLSPLNEETELDIDGTIQKLGGSALAPGIIGQQAEVIMTVSYTNFNQTGSKIPIIENLSATTLFQINKSKSDELVTCEEQISQSDRLVDKLEDTEDTYKNILIGVWSWYLACKIGGNYLTFLKLGDDDCSVSFTIASCTTTVILPLLGNQKDKVKEAQQKRAAICSAETVPDLDAGSSALGNLGYSLGALVAANYCLSGIGEVGETWGLSSENGKSVSDRVFSHEPLFGGSGGSGNTGSTQTTTTPSSTPTKSPPKNTGGSNALHE